MPNPAEKYQEDCGALNINHIRRSAQYLRPYKKQIAITVVLMFVATVTGLIGPYFLQLAIDVYIPQKNVAGVVWISILFMVMTCLNYICNRYKISFANRTGQQVLFDIRRDLFQHVQSLSFGFFDTHSTGKIIVRIVNDVNTLNNLFTNGIINVITDFSMLVVAAILMFVIHPRLALLTFVTIPFFMVFVFTIRNLNKKRWRLVRIKISNLNAYLHECISGMRVIQAYVRQQENRKIFHDVLDDVFNSWIRATYLNGTVGPVVNMVSIMGTILIYWYGAHLLNKGDVTVGVLIAFTGYLSRFWQPMGTLSNFYNQLVVAATSSERIFELLDEKPWITDSPQSRELDVVRGEISFEHVYFEYEKDKMILKDVNFKVSPGETIAIVGPTGSGKTTIINLIARFYDVTDGEVKIDGLNIKQIKQASLRKKVGVMLQEPFIFSGTIAENIKYAKEDASDEEVIAVSKAVGAHEFISKMKDGYESQVNERGAGLSIGQKQLIAFARVLLADPEILILDEATASVDTHTEVLLQKAIDKILEGRTSFVIAHRLSTIRNADKIMVVQQGRIVEMGTHDELLAKKGVYYNLYNVQYKFLKAV